MKFKKITIENFKSYGSEPITFNLDFNEIKLICGENGVGKTSFIDAILWCIYGATSLKADNVVNKTMKKNCKVELEFENNGKQYVITRYRKHDTHGNSVLIFEGTDESNRENITLKGSAENQELINNIISISYNALTNSVILSPEIYKTFLREKNSVRLQIFESVFSLKEINDYNQAVKKILRKTNDKKNELEMNKNSLQSSVNSEVEILKKYRESFKEKLDNIQREIDNSELELNRMKYSLEKKLSIDVDKERKRFEKYKDIKEKIQSYKELKIQRQREYTELENKISAINSDISKYTSSLSELEKVDVDKELSAISEYESKVEKIQKLENYLSEVETKIKLLNSEIKNKTILYESKRKELTEKTKKSEELVNNKNKCPTCGQIIDEEFHGLLVQKLIDEIYLLSKDKDEIIDEINELNEKKDKETAVYEKIKKSIPENPKPQYTKDFLLDINSQIYKLTVDRNNKQNELEIKTAELNDRKLDLDIVINELNNLEPEYDDSINYFDLNELEVIEKDISNLKIDIAVKEEFIKQKKEQLNVGIDKNYVDSIVASIGKKREEITNIDTELSDVFSKIEKLSILETVFSNNENGFKKYFIESTIDLFNENINMYLPFFFKDDINITFDKNLEETIMFKGEQTEFNELSSGQKTRAELAVVFSLFAMVRALFGTVTNLLILDEICDNTLDNSGVDAVMSILQDIASDSSVFMVSHRDEYKEKFKNVIKVSIDGNGFTKVEEQ